MQKSEYIFRLKKSLATLPYEELKKVLTSFEAKLTLMSEQEFVSFVDSQGTPEIFADKLMSDYCSRQLKKTVPQINSAATDRKFKIFRIKVNTPYKEGILTRIARKRGIDEKDMKSLKFVFGTLLVTAFIILSIFSTLIFVSVPLILFIASTLLFITCSTIFFAAIAGGYFAIMNMFVTFVIGSAEFGIAIMLMSVSIFIFAIARQIVMSFIPSFTYKAFSKYKKTFFDMRAFFFGQGTKNKKRWIKS